MLIASIGSSLLLITIFGYSFIFKFFLLKKNEKLNNIDFYYGLIFALFFSLFLNLFEPLKLFTIPIYLIGVSFFIFGFVKKLIEINLLKYLLIIFIFTFIAFYNGNNIDSPMYHLQIIKWMELHKVNFGLVNLEIRFGMNSSWHSIISLMDINLGKFSLKYYFNSLIVSVLVYEASIFSKNLEKSKLFLLASTLFLLFFSFLHPFGNGIILNHLGNPERDIFAMICYIFIFYLLIKCYEDDFEDDNLINLFIITIFLCVTSRISTIGILILPIIYIFFIKKITLINFTNIFVLITSLFWVIRNFILSGCLVFPIKSTCLNTQWSVNTDKMDYMIKEAMGLTRDAPFKTRHADYDYTINSLDWLGPWLKYYFFSTSFIQIALLMLLLSFILIILSKKKINNKNKLFYYIFLIPIILNFVIWFKAPEVRYAWGNLIAFPCFLIIVGISCHEKIIISINKNKSLIVSSVYILMFMLVFKNFDKLEYEHLFKISNKNFGYSNIEKIGNFDGHTIFKSKNWQCADFKEICINKEQSNYRIKNYKNYLFFLKN